jgi:hypothetical protein
VFGTQRRFYYGVAALSVLLLLAAWAVQVFVRPEAWRASSGIIEHLVVFSGGVEVAWQALDAANDLVSIDSSTDAAGVQGARVRAAVQARAARERAQELEELGESVIPLGKLGSLLLEAEEVTELALSGSPSQTVSAEQAAGADVLATDPNLAGVLPGTREETMQAIDRVGLKLRRLVAEAAQSVSAEQEYEATFAGLSARQWLIGLCSASAALAVMACVVALVSGTSTPEMIVEARIRAAGRTDLQRAVDLCYERVKSLLDLGESLTMGMTE